MPQDTVIEKWQDQINATLEQHPQQDAGGERLIGDCRRIAEAAGTERRRREHQPKRSRGIGEEGPGRPCGNSSGVRDDLPSQSHREGQQLVGGRANNPEEGTETPALDGTSPHDLPGELDAPREPGEPLAILQAIGMTNRTATKLRMEMTAGGDLRHDCS